MDPTQARNQQIANFIGRLLRDHFGKGPESVHVCISRTLMMVYLKNFLSPMERVLMESGRSATVFELRRELMSSLIPQIQAYVEIVTGNQLHEFYYDWAFHNKAGMMIGLSVNPFSESDPYEEMYEGKLPLEQEIVEISRQAQKVPEAISSCLLDSRTIVVIRNGILVRIEKELVREGLAPTLRRVKANLEKSLLHHDNHFESMLGRTVTDIFVDWDFDLDKSVISFVLNPKKPVGVDFRHMPLVQQTSDEPQ
ncbi:Na-translocating system protein MpsC family protein [Alicyclobacillus fastidiosus]|uniref:Na-translocating system protein MpsC family protein n=1 Tax=Alicyclobacillus fastidiosus TaxID=392011 RepID=A0ABV5ADA7_9BACL|nr:Na-translocating system protein MpsC family protein [Alicyclobacillus fastidiosus]WEH08720.1 Na-translocating system protein MpsC family protein [Alicyclobacillus fastidiosus]